MLNLTKNKLKLSLGTIALSLFLFSFLTVPTFADTADAEVTLDLAPILGISATDVAIEISPNVEKSYDFTTGVSTVTVSTNNITGYTLSIEGKDGSTVLHNSESNTDIASITDANISSTSFSPNSWGYTLSSGSSATYNPIPTATSEIKRTMSTVQSDETPVQFGISVLPTIASGRYQGVVTFTALANFVPETEGKEILTVAPTTIESTGGEIIATTNIDYSEAIGEITGSINNGENTITCQKSSDDASTTLNFSETENNKLQVSCYIPETDKIGENYALIISLTKFNKTYTSNPVITIKSPTPQFFKTATMQDVADTPNFCSSATTPLPSATATDTDGSHNNDTAYIPQVILKDIRDSKTYVIRKLADGNCWMVQNLDLDGGIPLTSVNSDLSAGYTIITSNSWGTSNPPSIGYVNNPGDKWLVDGTTSTTTQPSDPIQAKTRHVGNYYNFRAATGNNMYQTSPDHSICPKGWQLPTNSDNKSWYKLVVTTYAYPSYNNNNNKGSDQAVSPTANNTTLLNGALQLIRSGYFYGSGTDGQGSLGDFWSGVQSDNSGGYFLHFSNSYIYLQDVRSKIHGFTIRCVSRQ